MPDPAVMKGVLRHLCRTERRRVYDLLGDGELLARFLQERDEVAFEQILSRHGPMVRAVCRRMLGPSADGDDAFQATFLVLIRKARSIRRSELLAGWLCAVAYRTARQALRRRHRLGLREKALTGGTEPEHHDEPPRDWLPLFDDALQRLPGKYREAVVLCDLQGLPRSAAARSLGLNEGTLSSRLGRARDLLRKKLRHAGLPIAVGASLAPLTVPESLTASTVAAALSPGSASVAAVVLTGGVVSAMLLSKIKAAAACTAVVLVGVVAGLQFAGPKSLADGPSPKETPAPKEAPKTAAVKPAAAEAQPKDAVLPKEYEPFRGEWYVANVDNGTGKGNASTAGLDERWLFTGDALSTGGELKEDAAEKFELDPRAKPATIDFVLTRFTPDGTGKLLSSKYQGIYKFEPDGTLVISYRLNEAGYARPKRFATAERSGVTLLVLKRPEPPPPPAPPAMSPVAPSLDLPPSVMIPSPPLPDLKAVAPPIESTVRHDPPPTDLDRLQGFWAMASMDGHAPAAPDRRGETLEFLKDRVLSSDGTHGRIQLDESKSPKQMTITMSSKENELPMTAIYKLDGDVLTFASCSASPKLILTTFEPDAVAAISVVVYRRQKEPVAKDLPKDAPRVDPAPKAEKAPSPPAERDLLKEVDQLREQVKKLEKELKSRKPPER